MVKGVLNLVRFLACDRIHGMHFCIHFRPGYPGQVLFFIPYFYISKFMKTATGQLSRIGLVKDWSFWVLAEINPRLSLTSRLDWLHNRVLTIASGLHEHIEYSMTISERLTYDSRDSPEPPPDHHLPYVSKGMA